MIESKMLKFLLPISLSLLKGEVGESSRLVIILGTHPNPSLEKRRAC
jgi:hypothetical protein